MSNPRVEKLKAELKKRNDEREMSPLEAWVLEWMPLAKFYGYETEYQVDFYFIDIAWPDAKFGVELDGYEFHKDREQEDEIRDAYLREKGWKIKRIPSHECWNPKKLGVHLVDIHKHLNPGVAIPFALAELAGVDPRVPRPTVRKEYDVDGTHFVLDVVE